MTDFVVRSRKTSPYTDVLVTANTREEAVAQVVVTAAPGEEFEVTAVQPVPVGVSGASGTTGATGMARLEGPSGMTGPVGWDQYYPGSVMQQLLDAQGITQLPHAPGPTGPTGVTGTASVTGSSGASGPTGATY